MAVSRIETFKPYLTGFIAGLIAAPIIAFSAGWISTTAARSEAVANARIDALIGVCSAKAERIAVMQGTDVAAIKGYDNRAKREELVAAAVDDIQVPEALVKAVITGCSRTLA